MHSRFEFFVLKFKTLEDMEKALNDKSEYYEDGIEIITQELDPFEKKDKKYYNFLCKGKY